MADRIEREIEEILRKIDDFVPDGGRPRRQPSRKGNQRTNLAPGLFGRFLSSISLSQVMLWSLLIFIAAWFLRGIPGAGWVMVGAVIVFATAFVLQLTTPRAGRAPEKRWRGEPVSYHGPSWPARVKAWIKGRKKA
jgi:hypothetical protein